VTARWANCLHQPWLRRSAFFQIEGDYLCALHQLKIVSQVAETEFRHSTLLVAEQLSRSAQLQVGFGNFKAVRTPMLTGKMELYDLATDLGEQRDVAADHADLVKRAAKLMEKNRTKDPNWVAPSEETPEHRKAKRNTADE